MTGKRVLIAAVLDEVVIRRARQRLAPLVAWRELIEQRHVLGVVFQRTIDRCEFFERVGIGFVRGHLLPRLISALAERIQGGRVAFAEFREQTHSKRRTHRAHARHRRQSHVEAPDQLPQRRGRITGGDEFLREF
jgi:hypothetical protein